MPFAEADSLPKPNTISEEAQRVGQPPVHPYLEVEVHPGARSGAPGTADELTFGNTIAPAHERTGEMRVHGHDPVRMADLDHEPVPLVAPEPPDPDHLAGEGRVNLCMRPALDVDSLVEAPPAGAERGAEVPVQGHVEELPIWDSLRRLRVASSRRGGENGRENEPRGRGPGDHDARF